MAKGISREDQPGSLAYASGVWTCTADHSVPKHTLGAFFQDPLTGALFQYVKVTIGGTHANTLITGRPVYWDVIENFSTLTDIGGQDKEFAGVLCGAVTSGNYSWVQQKGLGKCLVTNSLTANSNCIPDDTNGCLKVTTAATDRQVAVNLEAGKNPATPVTTRVIINSIAFV